MHKITKYLSAIFLLFLIGCEIFEPPIKEGSLQISLVSERYVGKSVVKATTLSSVQCIVQKGTETVFDANLTRQNGSFHGEITDLEPAGNYSVLLYGKNTSEDIISRGYRSGITVTAGEQSSVNITWSSFQPTLSSPTDGITITDNTPGFNWNSVSNASNYELLVDNNSNFSSPEINQANLATAAYTPTNALSDDTYHWRVRAKDSQENWGGWSSTWNFTIDTQGPTGPSLTAPENGSTTSDNTPTFDWADVSEAIAYELEADDSIIFDSPEIDQANLTVSTHTPISTLSDGTYYWRVRAKDSQNNWGDWSSTWYINIDTQAPDAPTLMTPENGSILNNYTPTFVWSDVSDAAMYELEVDDSDAFDSPEIDQTNLTNSTYTPTNSLSDGTYYWRVRAKDSAENWSDWSNIWSFTLVPYETSTMTDQDGNVYQTVKIGDQWWMAQNLKVTHYRNGDVIPNVTDNTEWANLNTGAYCVYDNDESNVETYGYLYNWYTVDDYRNIAPEGWHVPTDDEWKELEMYLGMSESEADNTGWRGTDEGNKFKSTSGWHSEGMSTNESGFSALPGASRGGSHGNFDGLGFYAHFWSSSESNKYSAWRRALYHESSKIDRYNYDKRYGFSVRLVKGESNQATLSSLDLSPHSAFLYNNQLQQFTCTANYSDASTQDVTSAATWSISPGTVGSISNDGLFTASSSGTGTETITVNYRGMEATATVTVFPEPETSTMTDQDGNIYKTVKIGDQWWMAENLKVTHYRNGDPIPNITNNSEWYNLRSGAHCSYDNDESNVDTYGRLYNAYAVMDTRNLAPEGWHVATDKDWKEMEMYLGMSQSEADEWDYRGTDEGDMLKETGNSHWLSPSTIANNISGFKALPGGDRDWDKYERLGEFAAFWTSTLLVYNNNIVLAYRGLNHNSSQIIRSCPVMRYGLSVRLVKGENTIPMNFEMVDVEGGSFQMGGNDGQPREQPIHTVTVTSFEISKYEITNLQYAHFMNSVGVSLDGSLGGTRFIELGEPYCQIDYVDGLFVAENGKESYPAIEVTWYGAKAFCEWFGGRLPTEAEWEYAARGGNQSQGYIYSGSNTVDDVGWHWDNSYSSTNAITQGRGSQIIGSKEPNELGIYDMSGNVWEWCNDWYEENYYSISTSINPQGPSLGTVRVIRGGSWGGGYGGCTCSYRYWNDPSFAHYVHGFRVVRIKDE